MTRPAPENERFLSRWSRLKRAQSGSADAPAGTTETKPAGRMLEEPASALAGSKPPAMMGIASLDQSYGAPILAGLPTPGTPAVAQGSTCEMTPAVGGVDANQTPALPAIDSLTMDSDYAQFFQPKVPESMRRAAVKKLFADPHFNIMDGLDTYIDDYTKADPIPPEMLAKLWNLADIIDHPSNRQPEVVEAEADAPVAASPAIAEEMAGAGTTAQVSAISTPATAEPATSDLQPPDKPANPSA